MEFLLQTAQRTSSKSTANFYLEQHSEDLRTFNINLFYRLLKPSFNMGCAGYDATGVPKPPPPKKWRVSTIKASKYLKVDYLFEQCWLRSSDDTPLDLDLTSGPLMVKARHMDNIALWARGDHCLKNPILMSWWFCTHVGRIWFNSLS